MMKTSAHRIFRQRSAGENLWIEQVGLKRPSATAGKFSYSILEDEGMVGQAMFRELVEYSERKSGDLTVVLLGGRGAQAMYRHINKLSESAEYDELFGRLHIFTQDALAPLRMNNGLSFVRDFERLLGERFFTKIKSFTPMSTETDDIEGELQRYLDRLDSLGGIDVFYLGLGPEADAASHLCYIKPGSGATYRDIAGIIPISSSILEHHISKFKAGGTSVSSGDEAECRRATHILTLGPAAILGAGKVVQSIVDASTAPAKRNSFARLMATEISDDPSEMDRQLDENPGLWIKLHKNVSSFILPDLLEQNL